MFKRFVYPDDAPDDNEIPKSEDIVLCVRGGPHGHVDNFYRQSRRLATRGHVHPFVNFSDVTQYLKGSPFGKKQVSGERLAVNRGTPLMLLVEAPVRRYAFDAFSVIHQVRYVIADAISSGNILPCVVVDMQHAATMDPYLDAVICSDGPYEVLEEADKKDISVIKVTSATFPQDLRSAFKYIANHTVKTSLADGLIAA